MGVRSKLPRDSNLLAKTIIDIATGNAVPVDSADQHKNAAAVTLGRLGGLKGGKARASKLSPQDRSRIAKKAAKTRWKHK